MCFVFVVEKCGKNNDKKDVCFFVYKYKAFLLTQTHTYTIPVFPPI